MASLSTTALRLAVVEALAPTPLFDASTPNWPTLLGPRVLDSGSVPWGRTVIDPGFVLGSVYVDETRADPPSDEHGYDPEYIEVGLVIDLEIPIVDGADEMGIGAADADAVAKLELAATQIRRVLATSPLLVPRFVRGYRRFETRWDRDPELGVRLSRLMLRITVVIEDDDWDDVEGGLPAPASHVFAALPPGSYGGAVLAAIASTWEAPSDPTPLETVVFGFGPTMPDTLADAPVRGVVGTPPTE